MTAKGTREHPPRPWSANLIGSSTQSTPDWRACVVRMHARVSVHAAGRRSLLNSNAELLARCGHGEEARVRGARSERAVHGVRFQRAAIRVQGNGAQRAGVISYMLTK
eukprot:6178941-Pleurochrysis_carterae.AAC.2